MEESIRYLINRGKRNNLWIIQEGGEIGNGEEQIVVEKTAQGFTN